MMIELQSVTKLYGTVIGVNDITLSLSSRRVRATRSQRFGQDHAVESDHRPVATHDWPSHGDGPVALES